MQSRVEGSVRSKMSEMRIICEREILIQQQRMDSAHLSTQSSLQSVKSKAQQTRELQGKLQKLKAELREAEDALVKAISVKNRKEAKQMAIMDSLSSTRAKVEELKFALEDQRTQKDEYSAIIATQSSALTELQDKHCQNIEHTEEIEEAISWYNKVLGFRIECGHGVKFIFTNINLKNPDEQYSFTIRHENDIYTLLDCDPHMADTKELMNELNKSNGLFKFVRTMRGKFQEAASSGNFPQVSSHVQDSSTISVSAPVSSVSTHSGSESPAKQKELQHLDSNRHYRKARGGRQELLSPGSALSLRRSPRFKVKK